MESLGPFYRYINKFIELSADEFDHYIKPHIEIRHFDKKDTITKEGSVENYFNFVLKGLARKYYKNSRDEVCTQIASEGHIILVEDSFLSRRASGYCVDCIEPTHLASIQHHNLEKIFSSSTKMERMGRLVVTSIMVMREKWQMQLIKHSPRDRFLKFVHTHPALIQRVPQKYLASYLNIQPETFSRFKHLLRAKA